MPDQNHDNNTDVEQDLPPSKSELKRQMLALQQLGESLLELNDRQLALMPISDEEQLREDILAAGVNGVELATARWPQADRQQLRQLVLQHQRELQRDKPPAASRKLFRYLRELQELYGDTD